MSEILVHRKKASQLSLGTSHDLIYKTAIELLKNDRAEGTHLDFGAGRGELLKRLFVEFPEKQFHGIDLMDRPHQLNDSIQWRIGDLNETIGLNDHSFESISAIEIIEHLENPRQVFRELFRLLKIGGKLILSTPNNESWRAILSFILRGHFVDFTDNSYPAHITPMNRKDLCRAAQEAGFQSPVFTYVEGGRVPGLTRYSWQKLSFGSLKGLRYSDNLFIILKK